MPTHRYFLLLLKAAHLSCCLATLTLVAGCGNGYSADEAGVRALAGDLKGNPALLGELAPTLSDCKAIVTDDADATKLFEYTAALFKAVSEKGLDADADQTEVQVASATVAALKAGQAGEMPGGYAKIAPKLRDGLTFWLFRYAKPGETSGMRYDGLVHVNGRWVFVPKPWRPLG